MGCNPLGKLFSMAFAGNRRGKRPRKSSRQGRRRAWSPPPRQHAASQSNARTVTYRDDGPVVVAQPGRTFPIQEAGPVPAGNQKVHHLNHHPLPEADILPSPIARVAAVQEGGEDAAVYAVLGGTSYQQLSGLQQTGAAWRYAPSPVPSAAWVEHGERRREYFGGEYRYCYPTPVREGIYSIATDANRLTTMFSDENPNACSIV